MSIVGVDRESGFLMGFTRGHDTVPLYHKWNPNGPYLALAGEVFFFGDETIRAFYDEWIDWMRTDEWTNSIFQLPDIYPSEEKE